MAGTLSNLNSKLEAAYSISSSGSLGRERLLSELFAVPSETYENSSALDYLVTEERLAALRRAARYNLSLERIARRARLSTQLMRTLISGVGISRAKHVAILEALLFESADMEVTVLAALEDSALSGNVNAANSLLEKIFPERYGTKLVKQQVASEVTATVVTNEDKAMQAQQVLKQMRAQRSAVTSSF